PVHATNDLPMSGFDEWYVFEVVPTIFPRQNFVNRYGFSTLDSDNEATKMFWAQIEEAQPLHALGAGTPNMFFTTRDKVTFERVKRIGAFIDAAPTDQST
ncbi:MAG TPA: hypothetical protein VIG66_08420, partial [Noviherbaspirillum sp.]